MSAPPCPECGGLMREWGRGATRRKHGPQWICPVATSETVRDERGHLHRVAGAQHAYERVWSEDELATQLA